MGNDISKDNFRLSVITSCFKGEVFLCTFINQLKNQTLFSELVWILVHNEPSQAEMDIVREFSEKHPGKIKHIIKNPVEPISASWNRGWDVAGAEYVCFWNLDDCRTFDSLQRQVETLEEHPDCVMSYGDYMVVPQYGSTIGKRVKTNSYNRLIFQRKFPGGAFMVWRRNALDRLGYFDEQLQIACDYDLVTRAAASGLKMCRTSGLVGYFTNESKGLSTIIGENNEVIERTVVQMRYGMFDKVIQENLLVSEKYRISGILVGDNWLPIEKFVENYASFIKRRLFLQKFVRVRRLFMKLLKGTR